MDDKRRFRDERLKLVRRNLVNAYAIPSAVAKWERLLDELAPAQSQTRTPVAPSARALEKRAPLTRLKAARPPATGASRR